MSRPARVRRVLLPVPLAAASLLVVLPGIAPRVLADGPGDWQVWLDQPIPSSAAPGSTVHVGFIAWEAKDQSTVNVFGFEVRLHAATGTAAATVAEVKQDWPGHSAADLVVPKAGFGRLEFGVLWPRVTSASSRSVTLDFHAIPVAGVGPPPGISLRVIGTVTPAATQPVVTGRPFDVDLTFVPRVEWPPASLPLPDALTLRVRVPKADAAQEIEATLVDRSVARYRATVVVDQPGPYILEPAMEPDAPAGDRFTESETRVVADPPSATSASAAPAAPAVPAVGGPAGPASPVSPVSPVRPVSSPDPGLPVVLLAAVALVLVGVAWVLRFLRNEW